MAVNQIGAKPGRRAGEKGFTLVEPPAVSKREAVGFTLVELLVVVAIIVVLVSIVSPSLMRTREITRRAICRSNLHQTQIAHMCWAREHNAKYVEGQPVYFNTGHYACWFRGRTPPASHAEYGPYTKHAVLVYRQYLPTGRLFYCPSWTYEPVQYEFSGSWVRGAGYRGGGWFEDPARVPGAQIWMQTTYHYNCTFSNVAEPKIADMRSARIGESGHLPLMVDAFSDPDRSIDRQHIEGYNVLRIDGSTFFHADPENEIRDLNGGVTYHYGTANYEVHQVQAWRILAGDR